jgi:LysM repeat protein
VSELLIANKIKDPKLLQIGQVLVIPGSEVQSPPAEEGAPEEQGEQ